MSYGLKYSPWFYSSMMQNFKEKLYVIFTQTLRSIDTLGNNSVSVSEIYKIYLNKIKLVSGICTIIDDIILFCGNLDKIIIYLEWVCKVLLKYYISFRLDKYDFLKTRVKYVSHDITKAGNCPAQSKFNLINNWVLTPTRKSLFLIIGIVNLYHNYAPYFEIRLNPVRNFFKYYYRKPIPLMAWTPQLIALFSELIHSLTSSPVLALFDSDKPTFLNTNWSSEGIRWILIQSSTDKYSQHASKF